MAEARISQSQFLARLKKKKSVLASAAKSTPQGFMDDAEVIALFELDKSSKTVDFQISKIGFGIDKNKNEFFNFVYVVTGPDEYKGTRLSENFILDAKDEDRQQKAANRMYQRFQRFGYDTSEWADALEQLFAAIDEVNEAKPTGIMTVGSYTPPVKKKGDTPRTYVQLGVVRMYSEGDEGDEEAEEEEEESVATDTDADDEAADEGEEDASDDVSETPDASWVGLTAIYDGGEVELKKWNARKKLFTVYSEEEDQEYTVKPDDLEWAEEEE